VSNFARVRELNGGKLTRPKAKWKGRRRGPARSPFAAQMVQAAQLGYAVSRRTGSRERG
jgi:hypothetical protein